MRLHLAEMRLTRQSSEVTQKNQQQELRLKILFDTNRVALQIAQS